MMWGPSLSWEGNGKWGDCPGHCCPDHMALGRGWYRWCGQREKCSFHSSFSFTHTHSQKIRYYACASALLLKSYIMKKDLYILKCLRTEWALCASSGFWHCSFSEPWKACMSQTACRLPLDAPALAGRGSQCVQLVNNYCTAQWGWRIKVSHVNFLPRIWGSEEVLFRV